MSDEMRRLIASLPDSIIDPADGRGSHIVEVRDYSEEIEWERQCREIAEYYKGLGL